MTSNSYVEHIKAQMYPEMYPVLVQSDDLQFILRDGRYLFHCLPVEQVDLSDFKNTQVKKKLAKLFTAIAFIREFGLFLHIYGPAARWLEASKQITVDKTALRPIIVQNVNFIDPETGEVYNNRTAWGPVQFGFCGKVVERIAAIAENLKHQG